MYDDFNFAEYAFAPRTGFFCHLDELPLLNSIPVVAHRFVKSGSSITIVDPRCPPDFEDVIAGNFPYYLETIWYYPKAYMLVSYLGCPVLCCITLIDDRYEKSKNY